jgi:hypothetical protein
MNEKQRIEKSRLIFFLRIIFFTSFVTDVEIVLSQMLKTSNNLYEGAI